MVIIKRNRAQCLTCGEILESNGRVTDRRTCGCRSLSIDGGQSFLGRYCLYGEEGYKELSIIEEVSDGNNR